MPVFKVMLNRKTLFSACVRKKRNGWRVIGATSTSSDQNKRVAMYRVLVDHLLQDERFTRVLKERLGN